MNIQHTRSKNNLIIGPATAVDTLVLTIQDGVLCALMIQIAKGPYKDQWALPGGVVQVSETLDAAAGRVLEKKAGIQGVHMEQLYTFSDIDRDVRGRMISVAYFALVDSSDFTPKTLEYYKDIAWKDVTRLPHMAFDHKKIVQYGVDRLRAKIEYSNIVYGLLPKEFTLTDMQDVYEAILGRGIDKRNFRKKVLSLDILQETKKTRTGLKSRPAKLYKFKQRKIVFTN